MSDVEVRGVLTHQLPKRLRDRIIGGESDGRDSMPGRALLEELSLLFRGRLAIGDLARGPDDDLRETLPLDSLDFLQVVEILSERSGARIDEEDYPRLATMASAVDWLSRVATSARPG